MIWLNGQVCTISSLPHNLRLVQGVDLVSCLTAEIIWKRQFRVLCGEGSETNGEVFCDPLVMAVARPDGGRRILLPSISQL